MQPVIIGRTDERAVLTDLLNSRQSELLAIYGRRRVGKTYLIKSHYSEKLVFDYQFQSGIAYHQYPIVF